MIFFAASTGAVLKLGVDDHQIADNPRLVRVRPWVVRRQGAKNLRLARIGNVEDRRSLRPVLMADIGVIPVDDDLSSTRKLHPAEMANVRRCARRRAAIAFSGGQNFAHVAPPI
jgi:hypothetical protein